MGEQYQKIVLRTYLRIVVYDRKRYTTIVTAIKPSAAGAKVMAIIDGIYSFFRPAIQ